MAALLPLLKAIIIREQNMLHNFYFRFSLLFHVGVFHTRYLCISVRKRSFGMGFTMISLSICVRNDCVCNRNETIYSWEPRANAWKSEISNVCHAVQMRWWNLNPILVFFSWKNSLKLLEEWNKHENSDVHWQFVAALHTLLECWWLPQEPNHSEKIKERTHIALVSKTYTLKMKRTQIRCQSRYVVIARSGKQQKNERTNERFLFWFERQHMAFGENLWVFAWNVAP